MGSIPGVKVSVSLSDDDLAVLDRYVHRTGLPSRSAGVQHAIRMLAHPTLEEDYAGAWQEWSDTGQDEPWETVVGDGLDSAAR